MDDTPLIVGLLRAAIVVAALIPFAAAEAAEPATRTREADRQAILARLPERPPPPPCSVQAAGAEGNYAGFDLGLGGKLLAPVRFSSNGLIVASKKETLEGGALRFGGLKAAEASGLELADDDFVLVTPGQGTPDRKSVV